MSRVFWVAGAVGFSLFFFWRFLSSGATYDLVSALGFGLVSPFLWSRPVELFRPLRSEVKAAVARPLPRLGVLVSGSVGSLLVLVGAAWRWLAA